jgi:hypothetical protein
MAGEDKSLDALLDELVRGKDATEIFGETGLLQELTKRVVERALEAEMSAHLGYPKHAPEGRNGQNSRNGRTRKRIQTGTRAVEVEVPRDRDGSFEPQLVHNRSDGTSVILAGHRRSRAWQLLTLVGDAAEKIDAWVLDGLTPLEELIIIAAEQYHRQEHGALHTNAIIGTLWETWTAELGRDPSRRELARALPWKKTWVSDHVRVYTAMRNDDVAQRVRRLDTPSISVLANILGIANFASQLHALDVYAQKGSAAAERLVAQSKRQTSSAGKEKAGRPKQVVTRREHDDGRIELGIRYRPTMSADEARAALEALVEVDQKLRRIADGVAGPEDSADKPVA